MHLDAPQPFHLECGWLNAQAFRWKQEGNWLYGIVDGALIKVRNADGGDGIEFEGDAPASAVERYFRLDQDDIGDVHAALREADPEHMPRLVKKYGCIRVLRQDPWECLVAYICSPLAKIERIGSMVETLANKYGETRTLGDEKRRSFPSPQRLAKVDEAELNGLRLGLKKARTLHKVAQDIALRELDFDALSRVPHAEARERLMKYPGIGWKIADCVCLFSLGKDEAFPVDTHIGAALMKYYGKKYTPGAKNVRLLEWVRETFGPNAGYAGQLLFLDQLVEKRRQQVQDRYASEDSTIVIDGKALYHETGEHSHDFDDGSSVLHIHEGWDVPHTHRKEDVFDAWDRGEQD